MNSINIWEKVIESYREVKSEKYLGIFGNPVKHTLSPIIHDTISDELSLGERYIPFEIDENLGDCVRSAFENGIIGLNVTVPYKEKVIPFLSDIDSDAKRIGAVNTLVRTPKGFKGYNTDMEGLYRSIEEAGMRIKDNEIIMLGAGGAARAVAYMCKKYGAKKVYIINRSYEKAEKLAVDMNETDTGMEEKKREAIFFPVEAAGYNNIPTGKYMFIQCTSIGLKEEDGLPLIDDKNFYRQAVCAVDLIYNPQKTCFIKLMDEYGIKAINGLKMLLYQGIIANEYWNKIKIDNILAEKIYKKLETKFD